MKQNILLFILISSALIAQSNQACCTQCIDMLKTDSDKNTGETTLPAITALTAADTTGFDATKICGQIWTNNGGTCCDQQSVINRLDALKVRLEARAKASQKGMPKGVGLAKQAGKLMQRIFSPTGIAKLLQRGAAQGITQADIDKWKAILTKSDQLKDQEAGKEKVAVGAKFKACVELKLKLRFGFMCLMCSGNADTIYDPTTQKFTVQPDICTEFVDKCSQVMAFTARNKALIGIFQKIKRLIGGIKSSTPTNTQATAKPAPGSTAAREEEIVSDEAVLTNLDTCDPAAGCAQDATKRQQICSLLRVTGSNRATEPSATDFDLASQDIATSSGAARILMKAQDGYEEVSSNERVLQSQSNPDSSGYCVEGSAGVSFSSTNSGQSNTYESDSYSSVFMVNSLFLLISMLSLLISKDNVNF